MAKRKKVPMLFGGNELASDADRQQVLRTIGYDVDSPVPARMFSLVDEFLENSYSVIDPAYSYSIRDTESIQEDRATIEGSIVFHSQVIARLLEQSQKVAVFVATIGDHLEDIVAGLAEDGYMLNASVLDAIASNATEKVADLVHNMIDEEARELGLHTSRRFSPGYCDWDVNQQELIFHAMDGDSAGVRLTEGCLMLPRKSISGIIAIGNSNVESYNPCQSCPSLDCPGRRA
ncbi:MAG: vitamin B12 dependent-methionine synthase activation domain-containing protein [Chloroflexota bacterium]